MSDVVEKLRTAAAAARKRAHAPYSDFCVGAALLDERGQTHVGCNVENAAYPEGNCAETSAIAAMVVSGGKRIDQIVILGGRDQIQSCSPCGGCRQRLKEFADAKTQIWLLASDDKLKAHSIEALLPGGFGPQDL